MHINNTNQDSNLDLSSARTETVSSEKEQDDGSLSMIEATPPSAATKKCSRSVPKRKRGQSKRGSGSKKGNVKKKRKVVSRRNRRK